MDEDLHSGADDAEERMRERPLHSARTREEPSRGTHGKSWTRRAVGVVLTQLLVAAVFIGIPALVTAIAPVSWIKFSRRDGQVVAKSETCLLFCIPYRSSQVDAVARFDRRDVAGSQIRRRAGRSEPNRTTESQGFLVIQGSGRTVEVPVTPHDLDQVLERSQAFLAQPEPSELSMFVVANWKFSILMGGAFSLLTVLYFGTILLGLLMKLIQAIRRMTRMPR